MKPTERASALSLYFENKVQCGEVISGKMPLGYKVVEKKMEIDPEKAKIVQDIFRQYTAIRSIGAVRRYVLDTYGLIYCHTGMQTILKNQRYIGKAHGQDDFCPAIIEKEQFYHAQEIMKQRAQRNATKSNRVYLFSGLLYCAECGKVLNSYTSGGKYIYYRCKRYLELGVCTHRRQTSEIVLEKWLLGNLVSSYEGYNLSITQKPDRKQFDYEKGKITRKMSKLKDMYLNDLIERDVYEQDYTELRDKLRTIQKAEEQMPTPVDMEPIKTALEAYGKLSRAGKKEF